MSQTTDEDLIEETSRYENKAEECVDPIDGQRDDEEDEEQHKSYDFIVDNNNTESENRLNDEVLNYKKEIERISYLLKEKNLIINKLMIALSNQTQVCLDTILSQLLLFPQQ